MTHQTATDQNRKLKARFLIVLGVFLLWVAALGWLAMVASRKPRAEHAAAATSTRDTQIRVNEARIRLLVNNRHHGNPLLA